nr:DUF2625 family protein [Burkholderia contaminans]
MRWPGKRCARWARRCGRRSACGDVALEPSGEKHLTTDQRFSFYPFLWTKERSVEHSSRKAVSVSDLYALHADPGSAKVSRIRAWAGP